MDNKIEYKELGVYYGSAGSDLVNSVWPGNDGNYLVKSRINKTIGPIIASVHKNSIRRIVIFSWDNIDHTHAVCSILASALTIELTRKCAVLLQEGINSRIEKYSSHDVVYIPDVDLPSISGKMDEILGEASKAYPIQVVVGPCLSDVVTINSHVTSFLKRAQGAIVAVPNTSLPRKSIKQISNYMNGLGIKLLGILPYEELKN